MLHIAIVDDNPRDRITVMEYINEYFEQTVDFESPIFSEYENGEDFLQEFTPKRFDIVVLDIYMGGLDGMEVAKRLRETDHSVCLIFFTASREHVYAGYSVRAFQYVPKPLAEHRALFDDGLKNCLQHLTPDNAVLSAHVNKVSLSAPFRDILYVECQLRNAYLHFTDGRVLTVDEPISVIRKALLSDHRFMECHRNTLINMTHIYTMTNTDFEMKNGERVPFAIRRRAEFRRRYMDFFIAAGQEEV